MPELKIHRIANERTPQLVELWHAAFPTDPQDYIDNFFAHLPQDTVTLVGECDDSVVTMLFLLPAEARFRDKRYAVRYLYAGCTHPLHRGHGYYRELMLAAAQTVAAMGEDAIYLHPADERLTDTYKRLGYHAGVFRSNTSTPLPMTNLATVDAYLQNRRKIIDHVSQNTVFWDVKGDSLHFFVSDAVSRGATMFCNDTCVALTFEHTTIESIGKSTQRDNADHCLWLPIGDASLVSLMNEFNGITGLVGD